MNDTERLASFVSCFERAAMSSVARENATRAVLDFFGVRVSAEQAIPFPHKTHIEKAMLKCTEYCHEAATKGPRAGLPSVKTCMICHDAIATVPPGGIAA